ncbi:methyltransferase domain-containing protein [bacterium]|nr:methyltransferase domain-containing protein [bacterium]
MSIALSVGQVVWAEDLQPKQSSSSYQMVTGDDLEDGRNRWDALYRRRNYVYGREPAAFLKENIHLIPAGRALDVASGEGRNAVFLAKKGFVVDAIDISEEALKKARRLAKENHVTIKTIAADLNQYPLKTDYYEAIVVINFLDRKMIPLLKKALKRGGHIIFESYTIEQTQNPGGQALLRGDLLSHEELKNLFKEYKVLLYRESNDQKSAVASLIARKP